MIQLVCSPAIVDKDNRPSPAQLIQRPKHTFTGSGVLCFNVSFHLSWESSRPCITSNNIVRQFHLLLSINLILLRKNEL